jgi:uncharacterized protein with FMN-binding domain
MKRISFWLLSTVSGLALAFSYYTSTAGSVASANSAPVGSASSAKVDASKGPVTTFDGKAVPTRYGPVQVQLSVQAKKIVAVKLLKLPTGAMDQFIAKRSIPTLIKETLKSQSAHIDIVTTATYTSDGYISSLQSALDNVSQ